jgi:hypothetical protein
VDFVEDGELHVSEIWESRDDFQNWFDSDVKPNVPSVEIDVVRKVHIIRLMFAHHALPFRCGLHIPLIPTRYGLQPVANFAAMRPNASDLLGTLMDIPPLLTRTYK